MRSILDPSFRYTPSFATDLKKAFARIRRKNQQESARAIRTIADPRGNVASIVRDSATGALKVGKAPLWRPRLAHRREHGLCTSGEGPLNGLRAAGISPAHGGDNRGRPDWYVAGGS